MSVTVSATITDVSQRTGYMSKDEFVYSAGVSVCGPVVWLSHMSAAIYHHLDEDACPKAHITTATAARAQWSLIDSYLPSYLQSRRKNLTRVDTFG